MASPATTPSTSHLLKYKSGIHYTLVTGMTPLNSKVVATLKNKKRIKFIIYFSMNKFDWDHPAHLQLMSPSAIKQVSVVWDAYEATKDSHGICVIQEWDEFKVL